MSGGFEHDATSLQLSTASLVAGELLPSTQAMFFCDRSHHSSSSAYSPALAFQLTSGGRPHYYVSYHRNAFAQMKLPKYALPKVRSDFTMAAAPWLSGSRLHPFPEPTFLTILSPFLTFLLPYLAVLLISLLSFLGPSFSLILHFLLSLSCCLWNS